MLANRRQIFVRQHAALLKLSGAYDVVDPATGQVIGAVAETPPTWAKYLRLFVNKGFLPTAAEVTEAGSHRHCLRLEKSPGVFTHKVTVRNAEGQPIAHLKTKAFSLRSRLLLHAPDGRPLGELKGDWKGWDFTLRTPDGQELGKVTKKWAGLGKELFTTADSYMIALGDRVSASDGASTLLLAAGLAVDLALKEHSG
jgi:uncharacterized protein YxjI